ncbi:MAG TPA: S8 family serine peptidase [Candidatus Eisenbacteria bacterium]|nr:S8 family serine peptidase [Candidatus Eisenbacteria bacterium]
MNIRRLLFITLAVLVVCQLGWAQQASVVKNLALRAEQLGHGLPVQPASATPAGFYRPYVWVGGTLVKGMTQNVKPALPAFCNTAHAYGFLYCPNALQVAYGVPFKNTPAGRLNDGTGLTIVIVDAFHYANNEADLNQFSSDMGLPPCTKASGCFTNVDQNGGQNFCGGNANWELETMLDLEYAHAMAPGAKLVLVEGCTNSYGDLFTAVATGIGMGDILSNSYGSGEFGGETGFDPILNVNKPILFSSGDTGTPAQYPCASPYVTCVGGTSLQVNAAFQRTSETGWSGSGGGCSAFEAKPAYQSLNGITYCSSERAVPDIGAIAADTSEVAVLDSGNGGYFRVWGTSLATPLSAGIFAVDMQAKGGKFLHQIDGDLYVRGCHGTANCIGPGQINPYFFYDVVAGGDNGTGTLGPGYDMVTGMGVAFGKNMGGLYGIPTP